MLSPRQRGGDLARFYTVTEPRRHPRGHTVYKVTARIVSRKNPEDVQEIVVWKRYSDFKKLHKDLWQIHKNLCRHTELFPPFAKAIVFGRFDETVIEERRQCAEDLLQFSANIPALYNSKQLEEFFKVCYSFRPLYFQRALTFCKHISINLLVSTIITP
uniref:PX domain-containing protein n=1 Tax=Anas zonorhyncha TaxID=75864 RepID=A0A8B9VDD6_9AVES